MGCMIGLECEGEREVILLSGPQLPLHSQRKTAGYMRSVAFKCVKSASTLSKRQLLVQNLLYNTNKGCISQKQQWSQVPSLLIEFNRKLTTI